VRLAVSKHFKAKSIAHNVQQELISNRPDKAAVHYVQQAVPMLGQDKHSVKPVQQALHS